MTTVGRRASRPRVGSVWAATLMLGGVLIVAFPDVLFLGRSLATGQASGLPGTMPDGPWGFEGHRPARLHVSDGGCSAWYHEPIYEKIRQEYRRGRVPLWNRHAGVGAPLAADPQSGAFDLLRVPLLLTGGPVARDLQLLGRLLISGAGCFLLLRSLGLGGWGGMVGAALFMLNGHFVLNINWGNLGPVLLLPWVALAMVHAGRTGRPLAPAMAVAAAWLAGMPPSALIIVSAGLLSGVAAAWRHGRGRTALVIGTVLAGTCLAAAGLVPAAEYLRNAHTYHQAGDGLKSLPWSYLPVSMLPLSRGGWELGTPLGEATYMGTGAWVAFLLFILSRPHGGRTQRRVLTALGVVGVVVLLKSYGAPVINELGRLPGFDRTLFYKHAAPVLWLALAAGAAACTQGAGAARHRPWALVIATSVLCGVAGIRWVSGGGARLASSVGFGALVLALAAVRFRQHVAQGLVGLALLSEALLLVPRDHPSRHDTLAPPPCVSLLTEGRACGTDMILYPNLSSAVGVDDVRLLGPVWPRRYARFLEEALRLRLVDRLEGSERQLFHGRRWVLDFLGVRRLVSAGALATSIEPEDLVPDGACPSLPPKAVVVRIDDEYVRAIYHHPADPGEIPCRYFISLGKPCGFMFRVGLHPDVWKRGMGDGVTFQVTEGGEKLFSRWVDPKNRLEDRRWFTGAVTTGGELSLHALPGETSLYDWALWGDPRATGPEYPLIQKGQVSVYDNPRAMPYVSVRHQVRWVGDAETALRHVLSSEGESPTAAEAAPPSWWSVGALGGRAELRRRDGARIEIAVEGGGLLLVRELFYPGWEARVDGERVPVVAADYLFQGVPVPPGLRTVVLRFNPLSFRVGLGISAASLVVLGVWSRRRRMSKPAGSRAPMVEPSP